MKENRKSQESLNKDVIISFLRENKPYLAQEFGVEKIALFGSFARDEADEASDIDIGIEMKEKSFSKRFYLKEFLEKNFHRKVDVCHLDSMRKFIRDDIEKDLIYA